MDVDTERFNQGIIPHSSVLKQGNLEFKNYELKYWPETELVLWGLNFEVKAGEKIGIVGWTGAGKSTICLALCRIVEAHQGGIFIDGVDISTIELGYLRSKITIIPQDPTIFEGTLKFNLDPSGDNPDEEILRLINKACLTNLLTWDPLGLD